MPRPNPTSFLGPTAPWMTEASDEYVYPQTLSTASEALKKRLQARLRALEHGDVDTVLTEIRRQIGECAVDGDVIRAGDLSELAMDLVAAKEHAKHL